MRTTIHPEWSPVADELRERLDREMKMVEEHRARMELETAVAESVRARYDAALAAVAAIGRPIATLPPPPPPPSFSSHPPIAYVLAPYPQLHDRSSLPRARGGMLSNLVAVAGTALALSLVFLAARGVPVASAHALEPAPAAASSTTMTTTTKATCVETPITTSAVTTTVAAPTATQVAKMVAAPRARKTTASSPSPSLDAAMAAAPATTVAVAEPVTAPSADANVNADAPRLEQAARTAAMLRAQLDASP